MGVRSAIADRVIRAAKAFGGSEPPAMQQAAQDVSQMGPQNPFAPGEPVGPFDGYSRTPLSHDFVTGVNIASRPRIHERVSFDVLRSLIDNYDVAKICIWHRIDSIRSLDWKLIPSEGYEGDVSADIAVGMAALKKPDRKSPFKTWLAKWLYDILAYDAGTLYRMRNRGGRCVGLKVVDGTMIAPLQDYWGDSPDDPAEAYVQYARGLPWNWLTRSDLIYEPFRPRANSLYGEAPIETIILNANTDIRFQLYFLQRFSDGNIPEAFASAPEGWTPDEIEAFQGWWDSLIYGDQAAKHQIKWMPGGSTIAWSNEKDFTDQFSLFLMRKTAAAYHVVPSDLGFTETVNLSSSESQADVQHRVGELPLDDYVEGILTGFLEDDLGLHVQFAFDKGEEQEDQLAQAQADAIYIEHGSVGASEIREMRFGLTEPAGQVVPRFIMTTRAGPVPLASLMGTAGKIDPQTGAPDPGTPLPHEAFTEVPGVVPNPPLTEEPLAEQEYGPKAIPPAPPVQPQGTPVATDAAAPKVAKEAEGAPTTGITAETGIYGYDGPGSDDEDDEDKVALAKSELAAFRRFRQARRRAGEWRDFRFDGVDPVRAHNLNDSGRLAVRKDAGEIAVAGLAVLAADTGRVLMLQRALTDDDLAAGTWEFPGGHLEGGESPLAAAWREWQEETGSACAPGVQTGSWTASNGIYQGIVWTIESEAMVPVRSETVIANPDDPDGDCAESIAWWNPVDLPGNPVVRPELLADIDAVMAALGCTPDADCCGADCCAGGCCDGSAGCMCGPADVAKDVAFRTLNGSCACCGGTGEHPTGHECYRCDAGGTPSATEQAEPFCDEVFRDLALHAQGCPNCGQPPFLGSGDVAKAGDGQRPKGGEGAWPGWRLADKAAAYWAPLLTSAISSTLTPSVLGQVADAYLTARPDQDGDAPGKRDRNDAAYAWLVAWLATAGITLDATALAEGIVTDGYLIGAASADAVTSGTAADLGGWTPGDSSSAQDRVADLGAAAALAALLAAQGADVASRLTGGILAAIARTLAGADGGQRDSKGDGGRKGLAAALGAVVAAGALALAGVIGELYDAIASAAMDFYRAHTPQATFSWLTDPTLMNCPICLENEAADPRPLDEPWPSGDYAPGIHFKCVIGSTRVAAPTASAGMDNIQALSHREYVGDVVTIRTARGYELTATPNHPVATRSGWVPIAELQVGDHVLSSTSSEWPPFAVDVDVNDIPPRIEDVAQSLPVLLASVPVAAEDFHGDGAGSEVCVVRADGLLVDDIAAGRAQHVCEHLFGRRYSAVTGAIPLDAERSGHAERLGLGSAAHGGVGSGRLAAALLGSHPGVVDDRGGTPAAGLDASLDQPPADDASVHPEGFGESLFALAGQVAPGDQFIVDADAMTRGLVSPAALDAGRDEPFADVVLADAEGFCDRLEAVAADIAADQVISVRVHEFAGHVYNLETVDGWYIGNGIVTHNCGCALIPA